MDCVNMHNDNYLPFCYRLTMDFYLVVFKYLMESVHLCASFSSYNPWTHLDFNLLMS